MKWCEQCTDRLIASQSEWAGRSHSGVAVSFPCVSQPTCVSWSQRWEWQQGPTASGATGPTKPSCLWGCSSLPLTPWPSRWATTQAAYALTRVHLRTVYFASVYLYISTGLHFLHLHIESSVSAIVEWQDQSSLFFNSVIFTLLFLNLHESKTFPRLNLLNLYSREMHLKYRRKSV